MNQEFDEDRGSRLINTHATAHEHCTQVTGMTCNWALTTRIDEQKSVRIVNIGQLNVNKAVHTPKIEYTQDQCEIPQQDPF